VPQRLTSLQEYNALIAQRALQAQQAEEQLDVVESHEEEPALYLSYDGEEDDVDDDYDSGDVIVLPRRGGGTPRVGKRRRRQGLCSSGDSSSVSPHEKKRPRMTRRRLRREGRLMPIEEEEDKQEEEASCRFFEVVASLPEEDIKMAIFHALPVEDHQCRALLLRQWVFPLPSNPPLPSDPKLSTYTFSAANGTHFLCIADSEGKAAAT